MLIICRIGIKVYVLPPVLCLRHMPLRRRQ